MLGSKNPMDVTIYGGITITLSGGVYEGTDDLEQTFMSDSCEGMFSLLMNVVALIRAMSPKMGHEYMEFLVFSAHGTDHMDFSREECFGNVDKMTDLLTAENLLWIQRHCFI